MAAKLTKEELMEKIKDIDNEELKKKFGELTEEELKNVVGGTIDPDGKDSGIDYECPNCHKHNTMRLVYAFLCLDCQKTFAIL